jgi:hypothetical protein
MLKRLILKAQETSVLYYTKREALSQVALDKLLKRHSLQLLWDALRPTVQALRSAVVPPGQIDALNSYIRQLNEVDPQSVEFRYATNIEDTEAKLTRVQEHGGAIGIQNFAEGMERLAFWLDGVDGYFSDMVDGYHQMLSDSYDPSY